MTTLTETIHNGTALRARLIALSVNGEAWAYSVLPFSHEVTFESYASPCRVPDSYIDLMGMGIGYKGKIVSFTKAAIIRDQNRCVNSN